MESRLLQIHKILCIEYILICVQMVSHFSDYFIYEQLQSFSIRNSGSSSNSLEYLKNFLIIASLHSKHLIVCIPFLDSFFFSVFLPYKASSC